MFRKFLRYLKQNISILVDAGLRARVLHFSFPRWVMLVLILSVVSFTGHGGGSMVICTVNQTRANNLNRLTREREKLNDRYSDLEHEADSLAELITLLESHDLELRIFKNMETWPDDMLKLGVGGPAFQSEELTELQQMNSNYYDKAAELERKINLLNRKTRFQEESFTEIEARIIKEQDYLDHTPSVHPAEGRFTSGFGYRIDPFLHVPKMHTGIDISNRPGTPIQTSADGVVSFTGYLQGYGNTVKVDHGNGLETLYGHLGEFLIKEGEEVFRGDVIGLMGNTGRSTGPHLHYEVRVCGKPVNPKGYFLDD